MPPAPRNVPTAEAVKVEVFGVVRCRAAIRSYGRSHPQISHGATVFADDQHSIAVNAGDAPPPGSAARSEDLAARLRAFAAPPPEIASGSPPAAAANSRPVLAQSPQGAPPAPLSTASAASPAGPLPAIPPPGPDPLLGSCS